MRYVHCIHSTLFLHPMICTNQVQGRISTKLALWSRWVPGFYVRQEFDCLHWTNLESFVLWQETYQWYPLAECTKLLADHRYACFSCPEHSLAGEPNTETGTYGSSSSLDLKQLRVSLTFFLYVQCGISKNMKLKSWTMKLSDAFLLFQRSKELELQ